MKRILAGVFFVLLLTAGAALAQGLSDRPKAGALVGLSRTGQGATTSVTQAPPVALVPEVKEAPTAPAGQNTVHQDVIDRLHEPQHGKVFDSDRSFYEETNARISADGHLLTHQPDQLNDHSARIDARRVARCPLGYAMGADGTCNKNQVTGTAGAEAGK